MKKIIINFSNRWLYTFIAIGILTIIGVGVYAFTGPSGVGHDLSEIEPCGEGKILQTSGGAWSCVNMPEIPEGIIDTNAGTICSGATQFLAGDGTCKTGYLDADGVDTDTNTDYCSGGTCSGDLQVSGHVNSYSGTIANGLVYCSGGASFGSSTFTCNNPRVYFNVGLYDRRVVGTTTPTFNEYHASVTCAALHGKYSSYTISEKAFRPFSDIAGYNYDYRRWEQYGYSYYYMSSVTCTYL